MKTIAAVLFSATLLVACNTATPDKYFDIAVLNCNVLHGFANDILLQELQNPGVKLVEGSTEKTEPLTRKEVIESKISYIEESYSKVRDLKETAETKEMLSASKAVYAYVLPVYKNEYTQLAKKFDEGAPADELDAMAQHITTTYAAGFEKLMTALTDAGKPYAAKNNIPVKWDVQTSPE
ncbi:hypothetical protein I5907_15450 [Panacibacter sp. DH6]|uniref:Lipoprotein n=1 Tax=Panacibacter microcysteis TaxID=2793269 RepID=A0A931GY84_9BACT|nr:hypothetical protein [Panacibacter microcysteis]MBG9377639.1 hypothetical protein [Panacibacter microcysteis]